MPYIEATGAQVLTALVDIGYGIGIEKHYVSWTSVALNMANFAISLAAVTLPPAAFALLFGYGILGALTAYKHWGELYILFGSKTFGSLMLALVVKEFGYLRWLSPWFGDVGQILIFWLGVALIVHAVGEQYAGEIS